MISKEVEKKIFELFSDLMNVSIENLNNKSNPDNIENWDSLSHVKIIMLIEHHFNIELSPDEAMEIFSIGDAVKIVTSKMK